MGNALQTRQEEHRVKLNENIRVATRKRDRLKAQADAILVRVKAGMSTDQAADRVEFAALMTQSNMQGNVAKQFKNQLATLEKSVAVASTTDMFEETSKIVTKTAKGVDIKNVVKRAKKLERAEAVVDQAGDIMSQIESGTDDETANEAFDLAVEERNLVSENRLCDMPIVPKNRMVESEVRS